MSDGAIAAAVVVVVLVGCCCAAGGLWMMTKKNRGNNTAVDQQQLAHAPAYPPFGGGATPQGHSYPQQSPYRSDPAAI